MRTLFNKKRICLYLQDTTQPNYEIQKNSSEIKWRSANGRKTIWN